MTDKEYQRKRYEEEFKPAYDAFIALYPFTTENLDGEIWKPIPDWELYHGSNYGRVKSFHNGEVKIRKPSITMNGYLYVQLRKNGKYKHFRLNILVAKLFIPNPENKPQVNHIYSRFSNHVDCLEWSTSSENQIHAVRTGLHKSGEEHPDAKLTNEQVRYVRENPDDLTRKELAEKFCVAQPTISLIQLGKIYKDAGGKIREKKQGGVPRTPDDKRAQILAAYQPGVKGHSYRAVAKRFGVDAKTVWRIVNGK